MEEGKRQKTFRQYSNNRFGKGETPWSLYRWDDIPFEKGNLIVVPEGEKSVEGWWMNGIAATCPQGSCWTHHDLKRYTQQLKEKGLYPLILPDGDLAGQRKRDKWIEACKEVGLWYKVIDLESFPLWQSGWDSYELLMLYTTQFLVFIYSELGSFKEDAYMSS